MSFPDFMKHKEATQKIIDKHAYDFTYNNAKEYLSKVGWVKAYIRSLGGVFTKYVDFKGKITSYDQLNEIGDYVTGLYDVWGVDYSNGCSYTFEENRYKAYDGAKSAFYPAHEPKARFNMNYATTGFGNGDWLPTIEEQLEKGYAVTNCSQGVVQILKKAGLVPGSFPDPAYNPAFYKSHGYGYKLIKSMKELRPGDVLLLAHGSIPNRSKLTELSNWEPWLFHTTIVGEVGNDYIITYDTGHAYTYYGEPRNKRYFSQSPYEWCDDWIGMRLDVCAALAGQWVENNGKWSYIKDGQRLKGWQKLTWSHGMDWFYFDKDGIMVTGWLEDKGKWYFLASSGAMVTGWKKIRYSKGRAWFYFESNGAMICNALRQLKYGGEWNYYLFDKDGAMVTGKHKVVCKFSESGLQGGHL